MLIIIIGGVYLYVGYVFSTLAAKAASRQDLAQPFLGYEQNEQFPVVVPAGCVPGQQITVTLPGGISPPKLVTIPPGVYPGQTIMVNRYGL